MKWILYTLQLTFFLSLAAQAQERREFYSGVRGLAMGACVVATVYDETALALNPAALGKLRNFFGTIFDPELELGAKALSLYNSRAYSQPFSLSNVMPTVVSSPGDYYHARGQLMPSFVARNFGIGILQKYNMDLEAATGGTSVNAFYRDDLALLLGYNFRLWDGRIKIGFTGKLVSRIEVDESALDPNGALDLPTLGTNSIAKEGVGMGGDVGLILTAPWTFLPTIAAVARDVGGTNYTQSPGTRLATSTARPTSSTQDVDVGVALFPIHSQVARSTFTVEYKSVLTASTELDKSKLYHVGYELNLGDIFFFRLGYNQRYVTGGFELSSEKFQIQFATYGEEIGSSTTAIREDRRYVFKTSFRF